MRILVTGASGFLGAECVRQLRAARHDVVTTDRRGAPDILADLAEDSDVCRLPDADAIVHCAAVQYVSTDLPLFERRRYFDRNNVRATQHLARRYSGTGAHFVNVGSSMMYEQNGRDVYDEGSPWRAQGVYTASKIAAQEFVDRMPDPTACVVPCIIAGEGRGGLFASLVGSMRRWGTAVWPGRGLHKIHLVHVSDAAGLIHAVLDHGATGRFNAASSDPLSIAEWVTEIASALGLGRARRVQLPLWPIELASAATAYRLLAREQLLMLRIPHVLSTEKGRALGWTTRYTNAEIVRETALTLSRA